MDKNFEKIEIDTDKTILSSNSIITKTESFISQTKHLLNVDFLISKIAENILSFEKKNNNKSKYKFYKIETTSKSISFLIKIDFEYKNKNENNIIFFKFLSDDESKRQNDTRIINFLKSHKCFEVYLGQISNDFENEKFDKLYRVVDSLVNFPLLNDEQLSLVKLDNQNVIIQGVAGSGKTNVCIEKIVWAASKGYGGKILYSTFSRGLLNDTKLKIENFKHSLQNFFEQLKSGKVIFLDSDKKRAIENYLGIFFFANEDNILQKIEKIILFLENNVDYFLIEDLYKKYFDDVEFADENFFVNSYLKNTKNHQITNRLKSIEYLSYEIIYKEIFGLIFGSFDLNTTKGISLDDYIETRRESFDKTECETIFRIAMDYKKFVESQNMTDNNFASKIILENNQMLPRYSLAVLDEVQDFTQINLAMFKSIALKLFCTGDALQMINPSYFSFSYLKNLLYDKDLYSIAELKNNYRNTKKIQEIIDNLEVINKKKFGTHNFVTSGKGIDNTKTTTIFCSENNVVDEIAKNKYDSFTIVVNSKKQKAELRKLLKNQEILTIAEIKGLERDTIVLVNVLSDNYQKWKLLERLGINKKTADENSVFRYYFNLFYVGISRAKKNLFVFENKKIDDFVEFFKTNFANKSTKETIASLNKIVSKIEYTQDEYLERIQEFLKLEQFDNARFSAEKIDDDILRAKQLTIIDISQKYTHFGRYRDAGIKFWEAGLVDEAKKQFMLSGDKILIELMDSLAEKNHQNLNFEIVKYYSDIKNNDVAKKFMFDVLKTDIQNIRENQKDINKKLKNLRSNKNGK